MHIKQTNTLLTVCVAILASIIVFALWTSAFQTLVGPPRLFHPSAPAVFSGTLTTRGADTVAVHTLPLLKPPVASVLQTQVVHPSAMIPSEETVPANADAPALVEEIREDKSDLSVWEIGYRYRVSIPRLGIQTSILKPSMKYWKERQWDLLEEQMQVGLAYGAVAYPHSAEPGAIGSLIVAGHSSPPSEEAERSAFGHIFASLPSIRIGDRIEIRNGSTTMEYEVTGTDIVSPLETTLLKQQSDRSILKLITCYPVGSTRDRFIVMARLVE